MPLLVQKWTSPDFGTLKINTDIAFSKDKIGIRIITRNHMDIPLLAEAIPRNSNYYVKFGELLDIFEGYVSGMNYNEELLIESDSLLAINSFNNCLSGISELGT